MKKRNFSRSLIFLAFPFFLLGADPAISGNTDTMDSACQSKQKPLTTLCNIVENRFKDQQGKYVHLGGEYYLVSVPNAARIEQGIYAVNIESRKMVMFGGYGIPEIGNVITHENGVISIHQSQTSMSPASHWRAKFILDVRTNPISKTPFITKNEIHTWIDGTDEMRVFCGRDKNKDHPDCLKPWISGQKIGQKSITSSQSLVQAHKHALKVYRKKKSSESQPFQILEYAGIRDIIDKKPNDMTLQQYVILLNDYAYFAYQYRDGRNELAVALLKKVIDLAPDRTPAYLNMAQALEYLVKYNSSSIPLGTQAIAALKKSAANYRDRYQAMRADIK